MHVAQAQRTGFLCGNLLQIANDRFQHGRLLLFSHNWRNGHRSAEGMAELRNGIRTEDHRQALCLRRHHIVAVGHGRKGHRDVPRRKDQLLPCDGHLQGACCQADNLHHIMYMRRKRLFTNGPNVIFHVALLVEKRAIHHRHLPLFFPLKHSLYSSVSANIEIVK